MILFLPPYSPDLNPIELSFSTCELMPFHCKCYVLIFFVGKAYLRRNGLIIREAEDPILALLESTACVTGEMARGWFKHAGYTFE